MPKEKAWIVICRQPNCQWIDFAFESEDNAYFSGEQHSKRQHDCSEKIEVKQLPEVVNVPMLKQMLKSTNRHERFKLFQKWKQNYYPQ